MITARMEGPTIESIRENLMEKRFISAQLISQILINSMIQDEEKYNLAMSKATDILSKLVSNQHQSIIKGKTLEEV